MTLVTQRNGKQSGFRVTQSDGMTLSDAYSLFPPRARAHRDIPNKGSLASLGHSKRHWASQRRQDEQVAAGPVSPSPVETMRARETSA